MLSISIRYEGKLSYAMRALSPMLGSNSSQAETALSQMLGHDGTNRHTLLGKVLRHNGARIQNHGDVGVCLRRRGCAAVCDMRMDPSNQTLTAAEIVNTYTAADLARVIRHYSDEKWASRIADFIVAAREEAPLTSSEQLVDVIKAAVPASARRAGGHPAKRTFQALRWVVRKGQTYRSQNRK